MIILKCMRLFKEGAASEVKVSFQVNDSNSINFKKNQMELL